jgi:hypothetical protein
MAVQAWHMSMTRRSSFVFPLAGLVAFTGFGFSPALAQPSGEDVVGPRVIEMSSIAAPIRRDQRLVGYMFLSVRTTLAANVDVWATRERNHFLRDAFVRACFRNRLIDPDRPNEVIEPVASDAFRAAAIEVLGARAVHSVTVSRFQGMGQRDARG